MIISLMLVDWLVYLFNKKQLNFYFLNIKLKPVRVFLKITVIK